MHQLFVSFGSLIPGFWQGAHVGTQQQGHACVRPHPFNVAASGRIRGQAVPVDLGQVTQKSQLQVSLLDWLHCERHETKATFGPRQ